METTNLTEGVLKIIMSGTAEPPEPVLQLLSSKKMQSVQSDKPRMRVLLSDGKYSISSAMLVLSQSDSQNYEDMCVIKATRYITSVINNAKAEKGDTRIMLIMESEILTPGSQIKRKLGSPTPLTAEILSKSSGSSSSTSELNLRNGVTAKNSTSTNNTTLSTVNAKLSGHIVNPISTLSPYHNKWVIKARVTNKSAIRTWSNSRGEGKLFSMDLVDESGEIRCTAFKDQVDKYYDCIQIDKVYYISKCQLKPANKQYSNLKNDYEMTMTMETIIEECHEEDCGSIPQTKYDFISIDRISQIEVGSLIDVIGIARNTSDLQTFQARSTGRELKKKEIILTDPSKTAIALTLWGADAESFNGSNNPVVVIKGAKVGEFGGGKNISMVSGSQLKLNPELKECYRIRAWYDSEGSSVDPINISARSGFGSFETPWMCFRQMTEMGLGNSEKGDYYQVMGVILLVRAENLMYKSCPTEDCKKKLIDLENGLYRCEKCSRDYSNFKWRLLGSMNVGDWSGNQWITMFSSEMENVLGMSAEEIGSQVEQNVSALNDIAEKAHFKQFVIKCRAKMETYNDESRLKTVAVNVDPINYEEHNAYLIKAIIERMKA